MKCTLLLFFLQTLLVLTASASTINNAQRQQPENKKHGHDLVQRSCAHASYPDVCLRTLANYPGPASSPRDLAQAAVRVSLAHTRSASEFLAKTSTNARNNRPLADCVEQMGDSVDELSRTLLALRNLRNKNNNGAEFRWQMSNAETWVSAALTNEDTCLDGFKEVVGGGKKVREDVSKRVMDVARVTSNALYLINLLDQSRGRN